MRQKLLKCANKLDKRLDQKHLLRFNELLARCDSLAILRELFERFYFNLGGMILTRASELADEGNIDIMVDQSRWHYLHGMDDKAWEYLDKAKRFDPSNENILMLAVWLSYNYGKTDIFDSCKSLVTYFPSNEWGEKLMKKLKKEEEITEMYEPPFQTDWLKWQTKSCR